MKAVVLKGFGGPEVMEIDTVRKPVPRNGQVRIEVAATSLNRADISQRMGNYPPPSGESEILGLEVAGVVDRISPGDRHDWQPGDRVMGLVAGGGYAEYAIAYADHLIPIPESLSFLEAACIPEVYTTAFLNIFLVAGLGPSETVLLHGGGGGVNTAAIQLCRALAPQSRIIVTASSGKIDRVKGLGADRVINYQKESFDKAVIDFTGGMGADVILDHIGAKYLSPNLACLSVGGRLVIIGLLSGAEAKLNLGRMMVKRQQIIGSVLRARPVKEKGSITAAFREKVMPLIEKGTITPLIHKVYDLQEVQTAHEEMEASRHFGKIVLRLQG